MLPAHPAGLPARGSRRPPEPGPALRAPAAAL